MQQVWLDPGIQTIVIRVSDSLLVFLLCWPYSQAGSLHPVFLAAPGFHPPVWRPSSKRSFSTEVPEVNLIGLG